MQTTHLLTDEQLEEFRQNGVLVIESVLTSEEVDATREAFHRHLLTLGISHADVLSGATSIDTGARIKSPVAKIFYPDWKLLDVHLHPQVLQLTEELLVRTFGSGKDVDFQHPFEPFDRAFAFVDRICYRLPDHIREEGGLGLHLDRDPADPYLLATSQTQKKKQSKTSKNTAPISALTKWRPIQSFVALTDHYGGDSGGLRVVPEFHRQIDDYFRNRVEASGGGEFHRMHSVEHEALRSRLRPVDAPAGSLVLWDNRLPHATAAKLIGNDSREVVYTGFLPEISLNRNYARLQLEAIRKNMPPPAFSDSSDRLEKADRNWTEEQLSMDQRRVLGYEIETRHHH